MAAQIDELVVGNYVQVAATFFTERWAAEKFPQTYKSARLWGKVTRIHTSGKKIMIHFATDGRSYPAMLSSVVAFQIPEPDEYRNPRYEVASTCQVPENSVLEKRVPVKNKRYSEVDDGASDDTNEDFADALTRTQLAAATAATVSTASTSVSTQTASNFEYFKYPFEFNPVNLDQFCDRHGAAHVRFPPELRTQAPGYLEPVNLFKAMLPKSFLETTMHSLTNAQLGVAGQNEMPLREFWKYFGLRLAMTAFPSTPVHDFWSMTAHPLRPAHNFGQYGMSKHRFDAITAALTFWRGSNAADELHQIRELIDAFNRNMCATFRPSWLLCIDESMSQWTNRHTLPNWVYVERKPTPTGQEWHDIACSLTKIVFVIEPVQSVSYQKRFEDVHKPMAATILRLCETASLFGTPRVLVGDSAFPSLPVMKALHKEKIHCIFALKKKRGWTSGIPGDALLSRTASLSLGQSCCLQSDSSKEFKFFISGHLDIQPCLLLANASSMTIPANAPSQERYRKTVAGGLEQVRFQRAEVASLYYESRHAVDDSNNLRQGRSSLEESWGTHQWHLRTLAFILGLSEANAYFAYRYFAINSGQQVMTHFEFRLAICSDLLSDSCITPASTVHDVHPEEHRLLTFPMDRYFRGNRWVRRLRSKQLRHKFQRACGACQDGEIYRRVTTYCSCDPAHGMCRECWAAHLLTFSS